jgi:hypothetical protein
MRPGNIFVLHALQNMDGSMDMNCVAKKKMTAPLLDELSGDGSTRERSCAEV